MLQKGRRRRKSSRDALDGGARSALVRDSQVLQGEKGAEAQKDCISDMIGSEEGKS